jgi:PIN domain nuclease of toxin-antitoxin system
VRLLADTHILLWAIINPAKLPREARELLLDPEYEPFFSSASIWEIGIKSASRLRRFDVDVSDLHQALLESGYREVPILSTHGIAASALPLLHKDPFDRILIAQATVENILLITADAVISKYPGPIKLV